MADQFSGIVFLQYQIQCRTAST